MLYILDNAELETEYPDIRLWRQAHEPVIARDAFSSFMWILFCLPWPMLSCKESYLSLVHVFYVVSVTQVSRCSLLILSLIGICLLQAAARDFFTILCARP